MKDYLRVKIGIARPTRLSNIMLEQANGRILAEKTSLSVYNQVRRGTLTRMRNSGVLVVQDLIQEELRSTFGETS